MLAHGGILARYHGPMEAGPLLAWFAHHRRPLPWRTPFPRDPYLVVVSEVMLQQTQASRVAELLPAFLRRFPTLERLAQATEDEVVAAFAGLGYYRRARLLHRLAQQVVQKGWPRDPKGLARLPGLGPYTAAAVAAFAFGVLSPPVDGNLCRVTARLLALALPLGSASLRTRAEALAEGLARESGTPEVFEALMELGATVCTPAQPRCSDCPFAPRCAAYRHGDPAAYPRPRRRRAPEAPVWVALWVENLAGQVLLRRLTHPPLEGLWLPPLDRGEGEPALRAAHLAGLLGFPSRVQYVGSVRHHITHRRITVMLFQTEGGLAVREPGDGLQWAEPSAFFPTSSLGSKLADLVAGRRTKEAET